MRALAFLAVLLLTDAAWAQRPSTLNMSCAQARSYVADYWAESEPLRTSDVVPMRPERICREIEEWLPSDATIVVDTFHAAMWTAQMIKMKSSQSYLRCGGSLGWGFPAAIGAKCAVPERPVICLTGDGGFWYHLSELETARRHKINTVTIINNNGGLGQGIPDIHNMYGERAGNPGELYRFESVNFARIAQEMG